MKGARRFQVIWSRQAEEDLREIVLYIRDHEVRGRARTVLRKIRARADTLVTTPERGRWIPELDREFGMRVYRELVEGPWRMMYRIDEGQVIVVRVVDGRRNVEDILLKSLIGRPPAGSG